MIKSMKERWWNGRPIVVIEIGSGDEPPVKLADGETLTLQLEAGDAIIQYKAAENRFRESQIELTIDQMRWQNSKIKVSAGHLIVYDYSIETINHQGEQKQALILKVPLDPNVLIKYREAPPLSGTPDKTKQTSKLSDCPKCVDLGFWCGGHVVGIDDLKQVAEQGDGDV